MEEFSDTGNNNFLGRINERSRVIKPAYKPFEKKPVATDNYPFYSGEPDLSDPAIESISTDKFSFKNNDKEKNNDSEDAHLKTFLSAVDQHLNRHNVLKGEHKVTNPKELEEASVDLVKLALANLLYIQQQPLNNRSGYEAVKSFLLDKLNKEDKSNIDSAFQIQVPQNPIIELNLRTMEISESYLLRHHIDSRFANYDLDGGIVYDFNSLIKFVHELKEEGYHVYRVGGDTKGLKLTNDEGTTYGKLADGVLNYFQEIKENPEIYDLYVDSLRYILNLHTFKFVDKRLTNEEGVFNNIFRSYKNNLISDSLSKEKLTKFFVDAQFSALQASMIMEIFGINRTDLETGHASGNNLLASIAKILYDTKFNKKNTWTNILSHSIKSLRPSQLKEIRDYCSEFFTSENKFSIEEFVKKVPLLVGAGNGSDEWGIFFISENNLPQRLLNLIQTSLLKSLQKGNINSYNILPDGDEVVICPPFSAIPVIPKTVSNNSNANPGYIKSSNKRTKYELLTMGITEDMAEFIILLNDLTRSKEGNAQFIYEKLNKLKSEKPEILGNKVSNNSLISWDSDRNIVETGLRAIGPGAVILKLGILQELKENEGFREILGEAYSNNIDPTADASLMKIVLDVKPAERFHRAMMGRLRQN